MDRQNPPGPVDVDIRLLGPLELTVRRGDPVVITSARRRTLLGLLAARAPAVVSVDCLIDGLWRDDPPSSAVRTLHAHVAHLRRILHAAGAGGLLVTRAPGYALAVTRDSLDVHRFEELSTRGRAALADGDDDGASACLRSALALWRGELLADCPAGAWVGAEAARLTEARLYTVEDLCAADIARGEHARVAAELEALVATHPLRERLWELLMTAHHRGGRQGDALATYRRAREALVTELGVEPGAGLRGAEAAILRGVDHSADDDTATDPPAPIPVPITTLIGRHTEVAEVGKELATRRLVTLVGVGGCGKTRLAIAVAERRAEPVRFVDLTSATADALPAAVASALGAPPRADTAPIDLLARLLRRERVLLVLDNCEHLVAACARLVEFLLGRCPGLRVLATSREALGVLGEVAWPVPSLRTPPTSGPVGGIAALERYDAVRLFLDRAAVSAVRDLRDEDAPALAAICAGLDGLPLAIELAAARTSVLTVSQIGERLHDPTLLRGRGHGRHGTLEGTMTWSYELLDQATRSRFRRLSVFVGGFTMDAVERIWPELTGNVVDALDGLVTKSLVVITRPPGGARYRLLETLRRYAADRLAEEPDEATTARREHALHYRALAEEVDSNLHGPDLDRLLDRLGAEHDNLRAALDWFAANGSGLDELRFAAALARYCHLRGRYAEGRRWLAGALSRAPATPSAELARGLTGAARLAFFECDYVAASEHGERTLAVYRELADPHGTARSLSLLGSIARERGDYAGALVRYRAASEAYQRIDDATGVATTAQMSGFTCWLMADLDPAERLLDGALRQYRALRDPEGVASARVHLAAVACHRGESARARWLADDALARFRELGFDEGIAWALNILGLIEHADGAAERAYTALCGSLAIHCEVGDRWRAASVLDALAAVLATCQGTAVAAAELIGAATAVRDAIGTPVPPVEARAGAETVAVLRGVLSDLDRYAAHARGEALVLADLPARLADLVLPAAWTCAGGGVG